MKMRKKLKEQGPRIKVQGTRREDFVLTVALCHPEGILPPEAQRFFQNDFPGPWALRLEPFAFEIVEDFTTHTTTLNFPD